MNCELQSKLLISAEKDANDFNSQDIANTILALVEMQLLIADLHILQLIKKMIDRVRGYLESENFLTENKDRVALAITCLLYTEYYLSSTNTAAIIISGASSSCIEEIDNIKNDRAEVLDDGED